MKNFVGFCLGNLRENRPFRKTMLYCNLFGYCNISFSVLVMRYPNSEVLGPPLLRIFLALNHSLKYSPFLILHSLN